MKAFLIFVGIVVIIAAVFAIDGIFSNPATVMQDQTATTTQMSSMTLAGGELSVSYPAETFGLAVSKEQLAASNYQAYIPPCSEGFEYCFYYNDPKFKPTNFESAAVAITHRADLKTERACLETPPVGYNQTENASSTADSYSASMFAVSDAGAGHYASGHVYRVFVPATSSCYEFETRIGETQFANYPAGAKVEFTGADRSEVELALAKILDSVTLAATGEKIAFPYGE